MNSVAITCVHSMERSALLGEATPAITVFVNGAPINL